MVATSTDTSCRPQSLPNDVLLHIFSYVVDLRSVVSQVKQERSREASLDLYCALREEPPWLSAGKALACCACVCRSWRDALKGDGVQRSVAWALACRLHSCFTEDAGFVTGLAPDRCAGLETETAYRNEFRDRVWWYFTALEAISNSLCWPNKVDGVVAQFCANPAHAESAIRAVKAQADAVNCMSEEVLADFGLTTVPVGAAYWGKRALYYLRLKRAEAAFARFTEDGEREREALHRELDAVQGGAGDLPFWKAMHRQVCLPASERHIEQGATALASVQELQLAGVLVTESLDLLSLELDRRLRIMAAAKRGEALDPEAGKGYRESISDYKEELTDEEQIACLNSVMFNEKPTNGYAMKTLLDDIRASAYSRDGPALQRDLSEKGTDCLCEGWRGLGLRGNDLNYYDPRNSRIDCVLGLITERDGVFLRKDDVNYGNPILLAIVYAAVGRRAGVPVRMVNAPMHFMVAVGEDCFIDVFLGGKVLSGADMMARIRFTEDRHLRSSAKPSEVNRRLCYNLIAFFHRESDYENVSSPSPLQANGRHKMLTISSLPLLPCPPPPPSPAKELPCLRLALTCKPNDMEMLLRQANVDAIMDNYDRAIDSLARAESLSANTEAQGAIRRVTQHFRYAKASYLKQLSQTRLRPADGSLLFYVGQIIRHKRYNYRGVITGWDLKCEADVEWIRQMGVDKLPRGRDQPFYKVLVCCRDRPSAQCTYVAQENILVEADASRQPRLGQITHPEVGKHFESYKTRGVGGRHYFPNDMVRILYPEG